MGAREFFEGAREASADVETCRRVLDQLQEIAGRVGANSFGTHVRGGMAKDRLEYSVVKCADAEAKLHARIEADYQMIDLANAVIYGSAWVDGIADVAPREWWADAVYWRYLGLLSWAKVDQRTGHAYSNQAARSALLLCDRFNLVAMHMRHHDSDGWSIDV